MVTEIKMQLTPDLSERVQEIVFKNCGNCGEGSAKVLCIDKPYLFIDEFNEIRHSDKKEMFSNISFE